MIRATLLTLATTILSVGEALAGITADPAVLIFNSDGKPQSEQILVTNTGTGLAYVAVEPRQVTAPGEADEKLVADPDLIKLGLVAAPVRFILEPGERRAVRVIPQGGGTATDQVWRIKIAPQAGKVSGDATGVAVLVGYDALIIQRPAAPHAHLVGNRQGTTLDLRNDGNSFLVIQKGQACSAAGTCKPLVGKRLYGGKSWRMDLPFVDGSVELEVQGVGGAERKVKF